MRKEEIKVALRENPKLERALTIQLIAMGYLIQKSIPLYRQLDAIPEHIIGGLFDAIGGAIKGAPKAGFSLVGELFNLAEDSVVGTLNMVPGYPKIESYGQYCRRTRNSRRR